MGRRRWFSAGDAERERQGEKRAHRVERVNVALFTWQIRRVGNRREGVSVYQLAVKKISIRMHTHNDEREIIERENDAHSLML